MRYFLGLGSNLGRRRQNLARALQALEQAGVSVVKTSSLYKTEPVDGAGPGWFFNLVVEVETSLDPESLLELTSAIEKRLGRGSAKRPGPRAIDIDILLAEDEVIQSERLTVPHPRLEKRNFVLVPLAEISGETVHPVWQRKIRDLRTMSGDGAAVKKLFFPLRYKRATPRGLRKWTALVLHFLPKWLAHMRLFKKKYRVSCNRPKKGSETRA
ncbi:MAG: 2-amino-4-hydroxy-6-hydroxymethyldihydropteridine diphosphokinase [Candidatus Aminicenantales bacterium]